MTKNRDQTTCCRLGTHFKYKDTNQLQVRKKQKTKEKVIMQTVI